RNLAFGAKPLPAEGCAVSPGSRPSTRLASFSPVAVRQATASWSPFLFMRFQR
ncbi:hypothetical protein HMPREF0591_0221, partial [Mycobacterium parascrofulaceum ATCC BAA-614]